MNCFQFQPDRQYYSNLAKLERQMIESPTLESVNQIIQMYRKCVEYFDSKTDPIKYYFIEKIQQSLSETRTLMMMLNQNNKIQQEFKQSDKLDQKIIPQIQDNRKTRSKQVSMTIKLNNLLHEQQQDTLSIVKEFSNDVEKQDKLVQEQIKNQTNHIQKRLEQRQMNRKILSQSTSYSQFTIQ